MSGIFPDAINGGVPPASTNDAYTPTNAPANTALLYFPTNCAAFLTAEWLNSMISEVETVIDKAGLAYDATQQDNLYLALAQLIATQVNALVPGAVAAYIASVQVPLHDAGGNLIGHILP